MTEPRARQRKIKQLTSHAYPNGATCDVGHYASCRRSIDARQSGRTCATPHNQRSRSCSEVESCVGGGLGASPCSTHPLSNPATAHHASQSCRARGISSSTVGSTLREQFQRLCVGRLRILQRSGPCRTFSGSLCHVHKYMRVATVDGDVDRPIRKVPRERRFSGGHAVAMRDWVA